MWRAAGVCQGPSSNGSRRKVDVALDWGSSPKFGASPLIFLQRLKLATSNLVHSLGLPMPIIKSHAEERVGVALG